MRKKIEPQPTIQLPKKNINWKAVRDMIIYDMGGEDEWDPWIYS